MSYFRENFSHRLRSLLKYRGISQTALAKKMNIPFSTLNSYANGTRDANLDFIKSLCAELNCTMDYLLDINYVYPSSIEKFVQEHDFDLEYLSEVLGIEDGIIYAWAHGQFQLDDKDYSAIASLFGVSKEYIELLTSNLRNPVKQNTIDSNDELHQIISDLSAEESQCVIDYVRYIKSKRKI